MSHQRRDRLSWETGRALAVYTTVMPVQTRPQLGRLIVTPFATIGVLSAVLVWEIEHVGSIALALVIAAIGVVIGVIVARQLRRNIDSLTDYYTALLRRADEQSREAEAANRLKDEFLATLSHELRTPLNSVLGWARLLATGKLDAAQSEQALRAIERAGWAQSRLIEDLLDMSRIVAGKLEVTMRPTDLPQIVQAAIDSLRPAAEAKRITVAVSLDPGLATVAVDPDRLQQVVWNLVSNAIKFTPAGGSIEVRLERTATEIQADRVATPASASSRMSPRICSSGSARATAARRASTADSASGSAIVRHVVELHGGTVTAASGGEGAGSVFRVRLPLRPWRRADRASRRSSRPWRRRCAASR